MDEYTFMVSNNYLGPRINNKMPLILTNMSRLSDLYKAKETLRKEEQKEAGIRRHRFIIKMK